MSSCSKMYAPCELKNEFGTAFEQQMYERTIATARSNPPPIEPSGRRGPQLGAGGGRRRVAAGCGAKSQPRQRQCSAARQLGARTAQYDMDHFIETVRKYPCLWNTTAIEYRDQELKDAAWAEVMKETNLNSVKEGKLKWKKLRDSYRDALKRQSDMLAKDPTNLAKRNYPWKYMALMGFLQPHMSNRKKPTVPTVQDQNGRSESSDSSEGPPSPKRERVDLERASLARIPPPPPDPLDVFFSSMCQTTKRLPYPAQLKIKRVVFDAVLAGEEAALAEQASYAALWARHHDSSSSSEAADDTKAS